MIKRQQIQSLDKSQEAGYTIIESLVAMIVVSVLMIAIAPVMAYSVATRVQAKRIEMATQAAITYTNALKSEALKPGIRGFPTQDTSKNKLEDTAAPKNTDIDLLYCIDKDGDGCKNDSNQDLLVQGYYFNNLPATTDPTRTGYSLIVRVYRAGAFKDGGELTTQKKQADQKIQVQQGISSAGLGNLRAPLVEIRTEIGATDRQGAYNSFCDRFKNNDKKGCQE